MVVMQAIKTRILKRPVGCKAACATGVVKLDMKAVTAKRDETQSDDASERSQRDQTQSEDDGGATTSFKMPVAMREYVRTGTWKRPQIQALNDFQRNLRKKGSTEAADSILACKSTKDRMDVAMKLSMMKNDSAMLACQTDTRNVTKEAKGTAGWTTKYAI